LDKAEKDFVAKHTLRMPQPETQGERSIAEKNYLGWTLVPAALIKAWKSFPEFWSTFQVPSGCH
jgi:hypothetical protein